MRIVLIGQAAFGAAVLERLLTKDENVIAVFCPSGKGGDRLREAAAKCGVRFYQVPSMKSPHVDYEFRQLKPDLGIMAFVTEIVPPDILTKPALGTIQYHPSLLPRHRGGSAINWAVIMGETRTGLSIFWPDDGIDTGPILLQKEVDISPTDTVGSLYFNKLFPLGVDAIAEAVELIKAGSAPRLPQDELEATYEPLCDDKVAGIDWAKPAAQVYNLIRGTDPQPGAFTYLSGKKLRIFDSELLTGGVAGAPGTMLETSDAGFKVAADNGAILVKRLQPEGAAKMPAADFAGQAGLKAGTVLGK